MAYVRKKDNFQKEPITLLLFIVAIWSFEACLEPNQTTEMELSTKTITHFKINGIFVKSSPQTTGSASEHTSVTN